MVGCRIKNKHIVLILTVCIPELSFARSLNEAIESMLDYKGGVACAGLRAANGVPVGNLEKICDADVGNGDAGSNSGSSGGAAVFTSPAQKQGVQKDKDDVPQSAGKEAKTYTAENQISQHWSVFSVFQDGFLDRYQTETESGFVSDLHRFDLGGFYTPNQVMSLGLAFNYEKHAGDFMSGGNFDLESYGLTAVGAYYPLTNVHIDATFSLKNVDSNRVRKAEFAYELNDVDYAPVESNPEADFSYIRSALNVTAGYDMQFNAISVTPLFGLAYLLDDYGSYSESNGLGLDLNFHDDELRSLQAIFGVESSYVLPTEFGVLIPRVNLSWHHEFEDAARDVTISFVEDSAGVKFDYQTDPLDGGFGMFLAGMSGQLAHGVQVFGDVQTMFAHDFYNSTLIVLGVSVEL